MFFITFLCFFILIWSFILFLINFFCLFVSVCNILTFAFLLFWFTFLQVKECKLLYDLVGLVADLSQFISLQVIHEGWYRKTIECINRENEIKNQKAK